MNARILNREFQHPSDGWYQIEPKGEHPNRAAGLVQVIDNEATMAIVNRFNLEAAEGKLRHGREMLIDHEHFSDDPKQETRAYGWLTKLQNREDGVYGQVRWTATGKAAVDGGDYRFFSTEYDPGDLKVLNRRDAKVAEKRVRPARLGGLTLTNMNNNRGQKPITNRDEFRRGVDAGAGNNNANKKQTMKTIANKLGLSADASEESILAEVSKVMNRAETLEKQVAPLTEQVTSLTTLNKTLLDEQVDGLLAEHGVKEPKLVNRLKPVLAPLKNREERVTAIKELQEGFGGSKVNNSQRSTGLRILNRADGKTPGSVEAGEEDGKAASEKILNRANELKGANPGRTFDDCWNTAQREAAAAAA